MLGDLCRNTQVESSSSAEIMSCCHFSFCSHSQLDLQPRKRARKQSSRLPILAYPAAHQLDAEALRFEERTACRGAAPWRRSCRCRSTCRAIAGSNSETKRRVVLVDLAVLRLRAVMPSWMRSAVSPVVGFSLWRPTRMGRRQGDLVGEGLGLAEGGDLFDGD